MAFESTITEHDLDADSQHFVHGLHGGGPRGGDHDSGPDLAVDGLSESVLSRILGLFSPGRSSR